MILVDIRPEYEVNYRVFDVPNVYLLPFSSYRESFHNLPKRKPMIIVDSVGIKSLQVAQFLVDQGFSQVAYIIGNVIEWEHCDLPLTKDVDYQLNGGCACMIKSKK
ncbi:rhodanese-like domain-containing protein [Proteiniborus sp. MB09-C3]|uniref:rhodanese-like domain-containing protein n=1 Tax=Proteiniborus sp. MB09-C3 TaxID=3050072 RepID=UPI002552C280|nr:rhodanese-like domain-containing protein [Proteiniborus sp. MB09-C3]WIV11097.1 rhodanese-like domain-containing protein [Proteiniborus sp. MB09-C3]